MPPQSGKPWFQIAAVCSGIEQPNGPGRGVNLLGVADRFLFVPSNAQPPDFELVQLRFYGLLRDLKTPDLVLTFEVVRDDSGDVLSQQRFGRMVKVDTEGTEIFHTFDVNSEPGDYTLTVAVNADPTCTDVRFRLERTP